jgi:hypothetical protein
MRSVFPTSWLLASSLLLSSAAVRAQHVVLPPPPLPPPPPLGLVYLHIESPLPVTLTEHVGLRPLQYGFTGVTRRVCESPCDQVVDGRTGHEFTLDTPAFPEPGSFLLSRRAGPVRLYVKPGNTMGVEVARWLTGVGAAVHLFGAIGVGFGYSGTLSTPPAGLRAGAMGALITGTVALAVGIPLLMKASTRVHYEPDWKSAVGLSRGVFVF